MNSNPPKTLALQDQPKGVKLILRNGMEVICEGVSMSWAKHVRRSRAVLPLSNDKGQKLSVKGADILDIVPLT